MPEYLEVFVRSWPPWKPLACLLASAVWTAGAIPARAQETPTVRIVPSSLDLDQPGASGAPLLNAQLPASQSFFVEVAYPGKNRVRGTLEIWPAANGCDVPPDDGSRQFHKLAMTAVNEGDARILRAKVPPLQVAQKYCFRFSRSATLSERQAKALPIYGLPVFWEEVSKVCSKEFDPGEDPADERRMRKIEEGMSVAIRHALTELKVVTPRDAVVAATREGMLLFRDGGKTKCLELVRTDRESAAAEEQSKKAAENLKKTTEDIKNLVAKPLPSPPVPVVVHDKKPELITTFVNARVTPSSVSAQAVAELRAVKSQLQGQNEAQRWLRLLDEVLEPLERASRPDATKSSVTADLGKANAALKKLVAASSGYKGDFDFFSPEGNRIKQAQLANNTTRISADAALEQLYGLYGPNPVASNDREQWIRLFTELRDRRKDAGEKAKDAKEKNALFTSARGDLESLAKKALEADSVKDAVEVNADPVKLTSRAGSGTTPSAANYASLDVGVAVAVPTLGSDANVWLTPYAGFNVYAVPVDRAISFDQLVGPTFLQRVSLTGGITLAPVSLPGRTLRPILFDRFPLVAAGFRFSTYVRATGGVIFYQLQSSNPASVDSSLAFAPFLALSLDADLVHFINSQFVKSL